MRAILVSIPRQRRLPPALRVHASQQQGGRDPGGTGQRQGDGSDGHGEGPIKGFEVFLGSSALFTSGSSYSFNSIFAKPGTPKASIHSVPERPRAGAAVPR